MENLMIVSALIKLMGAYRITLCLRILLYIGVGQ